MWRDALLVAGKDLRIEWRSRVVLNQLLPFVGAVLLLFGIAFDADATLLRRTAPGLFWMTVLLSALIVLQRSFSLETADGGRDGLRVAGLRPASVFVGKALAAAAVLMTLEVLLAVGVSLLFKADLASGAALVVASCVLGTAGVVAPGVILGALASGLRVRETLLPLLFLPVVAPVMIGATQAFEAAIDPTVGAPSGWRWCGLLAVFAAGYSALGIALFEPLMEDT